MGTIVRSLMFVFLCSIASAQEYNAIFESRGTIPNDCAVQPLEYSARVIVFHDFTGNGRTTDDRPICSGACVPEGSVANYSDFYVESDSGFASPQYRAYLMDDLPAFYLCLYPWPDESVEWTSPNFVLEPRSQGNPQTIELPFATWTCSAEPLPHWGCGSDPWYIYASNGEPWPPPISVRFCTGSGVHVRVQDSLHIQTDYRLPCIEFRAPEPGLPAAIAQVDIDNIVEWTRVSLRLACQQSGFLDVEFLDAPPCGTIDTFTVVREGDSVRVRWNTTTEPTLSHFEIWRDHAIGGNHLRHVADVSSVGNPNGAEYEFVYYEPFVAYLWYTIFQVSNDSLRYADMRAYLPWATDASEPASVPGSIHVTAFPNPFNASTQIEFDLPANGEVILNIFDITGRLVTTLIHELLPPGRHTATFDGHDLASGLYFARLQNGENFSTHKMVLLK